MKYTWQFLALLIYRENAIKILNLSPYCVYLHISTSQQQDDEIVVPKKIVKLSETWRSQMKKDPDCQNMQVTYGKPEQFPVVLLASHDGGGSDWLAKFLEVVSGYYCGIDDNQKQVCIQHLTIHFDQFKSI